MRITIYTDGACDFHADNRPGGWAAILQAVGDDGEVKKEREISGGAEYTTNNRMELMAVIRGLQALTKATDVSIVTDSRYIIDIAEGIHKARKNHDLWLEYSSIAKQHRIDWKHVRGHSGDTLNERCDELAVAEKKRFAVQKTESRPKQPAFNFEAVYKIYLSTSTQDFETVWSTVIVHDDNPSELSGTLANTSGYEGVLKAAIVILSKLPTLEAAVLYTAAEFLSQGMNEWMAGWIKRNWMKRNKHPVKYKEHWLALRKLTQERQVQFEYVNKRERKHCRYFQRGKELTAEVLNRA